MKSLSHTAVQKLANCPLSYNLHYNVGLRLKQERSAGLRRGSAFSQAREHDTLEAIDDYYHKHHGRLLEEWMDTERQVVRLLYEGYRRRYPGKPGIKEFGFDLPVTGTKYRNNGRFDELLDNGWIVEDKLLSQWTNAHREALKLNLQITRYLDAYQQVFGSPALGVEYRVTRWPGIRHTKKETQREYLARLRDDILNSLDPTNQKIPGDKYYACHKQYRTSTELAEFRHDLAARAAEIEYRRGAGFWPRNTDACDRYGGCEFLPACRRDAGWTDLYTTPADRQQNHQSSSSTNDTGQEHDPVRAEEPGRVDATPMASR